jgi:nicotinate-nucleotide pyrophosphorylase (carboxylating)
MKLTPTEITPLVRAALHEDAPWGDLSSQTFLPADARVSARLVAREPGILSGEDIFAAAFTCTDPAIAVTFSLHDGERFIPNRTLATIEGPARSVLQAERVALNFLQRLSGIATLTSRYVAETIGTHCRITDTRKTTPGMRLFERYAVRCGGGSNHRYSLSDAVMLKDNHLAVLSASLQPQPDEKPSRRPPHRPRRDLAEAIREAAARLPHTTHIEIEVDRLDQIEPILRSGIVGTLMLDNFSLDDLRTGVTLARKLQPGILLEASGGVTLDRVRAIAATGVDLISVGALTHSAPALDLALDIEPA